MERTVRVTAAVAVVLLALLAVAAVAIGGGPGGSGSTPTRPAGADSDGDTAVAEPTRTATPAGPPMLLPNMRSLDASALRIEVTRNARRLRFAASLANLGPGPMLVLPRRGRDGCPAGRLRADQLVHVDPDRDGRFQRRRDPIGVRRAAGCMLDHRGHDHWHFDAMAAYSLRRPGTGVPLVARDKVSFCLRDNRRVPGQRVVVRREHFGECRRTGPQGISPGWVDVYKADLDGQWLRLPRGVDDEVICLDLEADPHNLLRETDETDNATSVAVRISGDQVRRAPRRSCS